jgi:signal transduction histidine kinase
MTAPLRRYRSPLIAAAVLVAASGVWAYDHVEEAVASDRVESVRHAESLAQGMTVLAVDSDPGGGDDAQIAAAVEAHLSIAQPIRFVQLRRGARAVVELGDVSHADAAATTGDAVPAETILDHAWRIVDRGDLRVVSRPLGGAWAPRGPRTGLDAPPPPDSQRPPDAGPPGAEQSGAGPPWSWRPSGAHAPETRQQGLWLVVGMTRDLPPGVQEALTRRVVTMLGLAWLAIAALVLAWVRSIREQELAAALEVERHERGLLADQNLAAAGLAHETKNPIGILRGMAQRLARDPTLSASQRDGVEQIMDEADRAVASLGDFIGFAQIKTPTWEVVAVAPLLERVAGVLRGDFEDAGVALRVHSDVDAVVADVAMLEQVLVNLLLNSLSACGPGSTTSVTVSAAADGATLEVADTGAGVPAELLPEIFKPYVSGRAGGHGLGLAIVKRIASQHGWSVTLDSAPGRGTTVTIADLRRSRPRTDGGAA